jgi:hypothetical protein
MPGATRTQRQPDGGTPISVPPGTPDWLTAELIALTLHVWQPYYREPLTLEAAVEIIRSAGLLFEALRRGS